MASPIQPKDNIPIESKSQVEHNSMKDAEGNFPGKGNEGRLEMDEQGFQETLETMPKGYYYSPFFIGTFLAIGFGFWAGNSGFAYAAPILPIINADLGPDPNVQWVALVHPVGLSVGMVSNGGRTGLPLPIVAMTTLDQFTNCFVLIRQSLVVSETFSVEDGFLYAVPSWPWSEH
jgi:hypothetical protein